MKNKKKVWGIVLIVLPVIGLPVVLTLYAVLGFVGQSMGELSEAAITGFRIGKMLLGLFGMIFVLGGLVMVPTGIVLLAKSDKKEEKPQ